MAPLPLPDGARARTRKGDKLWTTVARGAVKAPAMPGATSIEDPDQRKTASQYWKALWRDLGAIYTDADRFPLARLCVLHSQAIHGRLGAQLQTELRQLEQAFGGNPIGRFSALVHNRVGGCDGGGESMALIRRTDR